MDRYQFAILTRHGQKIDSLVIGGADQAQAERKLHQMYRDCTILNCTVREVVEKVKPVNSMEDLLTLISK